ncbi:v-type proton ATPase 16 kDa proteolipid subunit [Populus alba x Populus x berolinensis]|uniref:V-type proton ATPase proteolipid subunit n=1 Tax=Populus alba x Populus x berolinensis TaxID=444605 RepID=A0AAD6QFX2_9ROSI|nr:v-type proton ATPase 16 kDa proteolipid subunit [Populus alba x Populus x berolinensis]
MASTFSGDETAPFFGFLGAAAAPRIFMSSVDGSDETGTSNEINSSGCDGCVLGIYGLIIAVIISTGINPKAKSYYLFDGYAHLSSGLACGLAGLSAGMAIGIVGDAGVRANAQQPKLFVGMILILIFAEALVYMDLLLASSSLLVLANPEQSRKLVFGMALLFSGW